MGRRCALVMDDAGRAELEWLSRSGLRAEADRARDGVAALRSRPRSGRTPRKRLAALAVAGEVLSGPAADGPLWTLVRLAREIEARSGETISPGHLSVVLRKGAIAGAGRATP